MKLSISHKKQIADRQIFSTRRIEALTDGVFAIAMTLLVLDLKVDDMSSVASSSELYSILTNQLSGLSTFVISFLLLGSMWAVHSRQFEYIAKSDRHLTMINTIRLLVVVLIPLTTSIAGRYQELVLGRILLPLNFLLLALVSFWQWGYATNPKSKLYDTKMTSELLDYSNIRNKTIIYLSILVVISSIFIGEIAFILLAFSPMVERFIYSRRS